MCCCRHDESTRPPASHLSRSRPTIASAMTWLDSSGVGIYDSPRGRFARRTSNKQSLPAASSDFASSPMLAYRGF